MICPHCNAYEDATLTAQHLFDAYDNDKSQYGAVVYKCTHCQRPYLVVYRLDPEHKKATFETILPSEDYKFENDMLEKLSPRFLDMYNQAISAENKGSIELAAIGYRASLEILVKDYAVTELGKDKIEVSNKSLMKAIEEYLNQPSLIKTADVIRILGNDYAHYERKYPEHDFNLLKSYMDVFLHIIQTELMVRHPPVTR